MAYLMKKILRGFVFAYNGLCYAFKTQVNFRIHLYSLIAVAVLGWFYNLSGNQWLAIVAVSGIVLITELINTSIEILVDFVSPDYNIKAGTIKDISAAAVLLAAITAVITGLIIFVPKFLHAS